MYEKFFGLTEKPFSIQPDPSFLYWGRTHRLAYAMLEYGVLNHAGISVVTGEVGCGKTTLIHRLLDQLSDTHTVALLSNIQEGRGDLLSWVLMGFGQPFSGKTHVELFSDVQSFFISEYAKGKRVVMIIDEAQNLSLDMLEELRLLSNINAGKDQLLQLILVGQPQLKGLLNRPELVQLAQRVGSDFHLTPLSRDEVHAYIETRLAIAGCRRRVFTDRAIDLIAEKSRGVPRIINVIADTALVYAFSSEELVVGVESIRSVIRDKTDYGVFGLAADEETAPPIKPTKDDAIDKFSLQTDRAPTPGDDGSASQSTGGRGNPSDTIKPKQPVIGEQPIVSATAQTKTLTDVAASVKAPAEKPEAVQTATAGKTVAREESAITGIVVVGEDPKISPEATIRSAGDGRAIVYVLTKKSPTTVEIARKAGAVVVEHAEKALNSRGRARNAGYRQLKKIMPHLQYVQFIDAGDAVDPDWISNAERFMARRPEVTIVEGVVQKGGDKQSNQSVLESAEPIGETQSISTGAAFMRADAFEAVGGFRGDLATASFVDLCIRQRRRGGRIWRTEKPMIISRKKSENLSSWWSKKVDGGFRSAFLASLHGGPPERLGVMETIGNVFWGFAFPAAIFVFSIFGVVAASKYSPGMPWYFIIAVIFGFGAAIYGVRYILQVFAGGIFKKSSWANAFGDVLGKLPEFFGVLKFLFNKKARAA